MMETINLIPEALAVTRERRRHLKGWGLGVAVGAVILVVPILLNQVREAEAARLQRRSVALQAKFRNERATLAALTERANDAVVQLQRAKALRSKRAWSALIARIAERLPDGCWLTSIATDPAAPGGSTSQGAAARLTQKKKHDVTVTIDAPRALRIAGFATDAVEPHQFVRALKETNVFSNVTLETSRRENVSGAFYFRFELRCEW